MRSWRPVGTQSTRALYCLTLTRFDFVLRTASVVFIVWGWLGQFIQKTFEIARANVRVNGRNLDEVPEAEEGAQPSYSCWFRVVLIRTPDSEMFDEGLDRRIWSLSEQCMQWDVDISKKRRERPLEVERLMEDLLSQSDGDEPLEEDPMVDVGEEGEVFSQQPTCYLHTLGLIPPDLGDLAGKVNDTCEELHHVRTTGIALGSHPRFSPGRPNSIPEIRDSSEHTERATKVKDNMKDIPPRAQLYIIELIGTNVQRIALAIHTLGVLSPLPFICLVSTRFYCSFYCFSRFLPSPRPPALN